MQGRRVFVWALPCLAPVASVEVSRECGAICSLCVGPRVRQSIHEVLTSWLSGLLGESLHPL